MLCISANRSGRSWIDAPVEHVHMSRNLRCTHCFCELDPRDKFCSTCGAPVSMTCTACGLLTPYAALFCPGCGTDMGSEAHAERRQVSIMYCDLVRSTEMSFKLDPEEMREVITAFQDCCEQIIRSSGGYVSRYVGDGIQAYFGYPHADENAVEIAVRGGLKVCAAVGQLDNPLGGKLAVRVGLATGIVVVGDVVGTGFARQFHAVGGAANLAARVQEIAAPGVVAIADATRKLVGEQFLLRDLGQHLLKGCTEPQTVWAVLGPAPSYTRFTKIRQLSGMTLMCRHQEAQALARLKNAAWATSGLAVLISGDAGMGKSHLAAWLAAQVSKQDHIKLQYQCTRYHRGSALRPFINQLTDAAGLRVTDSPENLINKLKTLLALSGVDVLAATPLFAALLSISVADGQAPLAISPDQQRQQTLQALLDQLTGLASRAPVLIVFEDIQWADASSLELLGMVLAHIRTLPVMVVMTCRSGFKAAWIEHEGVHRVELGRLDVSEARSMVELLAAPTPLAETLIDGIVHRSDGVPLYIEELTKAVVCAGLDGIPESLRDTLVARLDSLPALKEVAQICAAIGRDFSYELLQAVSACDEAILEDALAQLEAADLMQVQEGSVPRSYRFRHALVQEAAYETLLISRRQAIHRRIADVLLRHFPAVAEREPELLAHHFTFAGVNDSALTWWQHAGNWAVKRSAYREAAAHFSRAISLAEALPVSADMRLRQLDLQIAFGQVMLATHGYGASESTLAFKKARLLAAEIEDISQRCAVYYALWAGSHVRAELVPMREMADAFMLDVAHRPHSPEAGIAHRILGVTRAFEGNFVDAKLHLMRALAIYDPERDRPLAYRFGQDYAVAAQGNLALIQLALGEVEQARLIAQAAVTNGLHSGHAPTVAYGHAYRCFFAALSHDAASALPDAQALVRLSQERNMHWWVAAGLFYRGLTRWHAGETEAGEAEMRHGLALCHQHGLAAPPNHYEMLMADIEGGTQREAQALARLDAVMARIELTGEHWLEAEVHRRRARLLAHLHPRNPTMAENELKKAMLIAGQQKALTFELRAALSLAHLQEASTQAHHALHEVYTKFDAPVDLPEWREAAACLSVTR